MTATITIRIAFCCALLSSATADAQNWPQFRGDRAGVAADDKRLPERWSTTENIAWKIDIPGRSWSSPVVWGNHVFVVTAINAAQPNPTLNPVGTYLARSLGGPVTGGDITKPTDEHRWVLYDVDFRRVLFRSNDFFELLIWQLANELRIEVLKLTERPPLAYDWKFRGQIEDAVDSICRNIAEGYAADTHGGFAWYLRVSWRSLNELRDALQSMLLKRHATAIELAPAFGLVHRVRPAMKKLIAYLERTPHYRQRRSRPKLPMDRRPGSPKDIAPPPTEQRSSPNNDDDPQKSRPKPPDAKPPK